MLSYAGHVQFTRSSAQPRRGYYFLFQHALINRSSRRATNHRHERWRDGHLWWVHLDPAFSVQFLRGLPRREGPRPDINDSLARPVEFIYEVIGGRYQTVVLSGHDVSLDYRCVVQVYEVVEVERDGVKVLA